MAGIDTAVIRILTKPEEIREILIPVMIAAGDEIPDPRRCIAVIELDEKGVVAYQIIQHVVFLEGLWARDHSAHLRAIYRAATNFLGNKLGVRTICTLTRTDRNGRRIAALAHRLGFEEVPLTLHRKDL